MAIVAFSAFAALSSAAALHAKAEANEVSGRLLSLRLSSFLLEQGAVSSGDSYGGGYFSANELDLEKLRSLDLRPLLLQIGKSHLKVSLDVGGGEIFSAEAGEGASAQPEAFCTARLALISGKISRLEACVS